jgi:hypothetical protein
VYMHLVYIHFLSLVYAFFIKIYLNFHQYNQYYSLKSEIKNERMKIVGIFKKKKKKLLMIINILYLFIKL